MDVWTPHFWPSYDRQYGIFDKMQHFRQTYQKHSVYNRVPPVYDPWIGAITVAEQFSSYPAAISQTPLALTALHRDHSTAEYLPLDESSSPRKTAQQRRPWCQVSREASPDGASRLEGDGTSRLRGGGGAPPVNSGDEEDQEGGARRESTPDSTGSDPQDTRSYCKVVTFQDPNGQSRKMVFPKALDLDRPKRARTNFTSYQLERLESEFKSNQYMVGRDRARLAKKLDLTETQVKVWFQNRRTKFKREQSRVAEFQEKNAESLAACNILRLLQNQQGDAPMAPSVGPISPITRSSIMSW